MRHLPPDRRLVLGLLLCALVACSDEKGLEPIPPVDRIVIGELKKTSAIGEITESAAIARAQNFANDLRRGHWSSFQVVHSSCGTVLLSFRAKGKDVGYLGLDGSHFFAHGSGGQVSQAAPAAKVAEFLSLLPRGYERSKCVG
jgi:hypothetical protein